MPLGDPDNPDLSADLGAPTPTQSILNRCLAAGFARAGVCDAAPSAHSDAFREWLAAGKHGSMAWLANNTDLRTDPAKILPGTRSIVMVADLYASRAHDNTESGAPGRGRIARYARGDDYHKTFKKRLHAICDDLRDQHPSADFRAFVDTAPIPERELAARAGLGWIGKHTLLINPTIGSWLLLGGFLTTLDLRPNPAHEPDHCGSCSRCIDACPTNAITPYSVDASRCISYLTIERRAEIASDHHAPIGDWIFGCDICQEVCPHNSQRDAALLGNTGATVPDRYQNRPGSFDLLEVLGWNDNSRARALKGTAMKRATLEMWHRNARIAAKNDGSHERTRSSDRD